MATADQRPMGRSQRMLGLGQYAFAPLDRSLNKVYPELLSVGGLGLIDVSSWLGKRRRRNYRPANRPRERTDTGRCKKESNSHSADRHDRLHPRRFVITLRC